VNRTSTSVAAPHSGIIGLTSQTRPHSSVSAPSKKPSGTFGNGFGRKFSAAPVPHLPLFNSLKNGQSPAKRCLSPVAANPSYVTATSSRALLSISPNATETKLYDKPRPLL